MMRRLWTTMCDCLRAAPHRAYRFWEALKVEMHGKYSVERMGQLQRYSVRTSPWRALAWLFFTPLPCLVVSIGVELLPLEPPERGFAGSKMVWLRFFLVGFILLYAIMEQCFLFVPELPRSSGLVCGIAVVSSGVTLVSIGGYAYVIGYPVPFVVTLSAPFSCGSIALLVSILLREPLQRSATARARLRQFVVVVVTQVSTVYIYPIYSYVFTLLTGNAQTAFSLLLPLVKVAAKNWMSYLIKHAEDDKAEFITFHVEVFHSMFVATCLQGSTSIATSLAIALFDVVEAVLSLRDLQLLLDSIHDCLDGAMTPVGRRDSDSVDTGPRHTRTNRANRQRGDANSKPATTTCELHYLEAAVFLLQSDERVRTHSSLRLRSYAPCNQNTVRHHVIGPHATWVRPIETVPEALPVVLLASELKLQPVAGATVKKGPTTPKSEARGSTARVAPVSVPSGGSTTGLGPTVVAVTRPPEAFILPNAVHPDAAHTPTHQLNLCESDKRVLLAMDASTRLAFVQKVQHALYMSEFLLLIEFVEMMIPCVYSTFLCMPGMLAYVMGE